MEREPDYQGDPGLKVVSYHEAGHVLLFGALGGEVVGATIKPKDNYLGLAWGRLNPRRSFKDRLWDKMVLCFAGQVAEELIGERDHGGCGGDYSQARSAGEFLSEVFYAGKISTGKLISEALTHCRTIMRNYGLGVLRATAEEIYQKGTVVY